MGPVIGRRSIDDVVRDFGVLVGNFEKLLSESGSKTNIKSTKLGKYQKMLDDLSGMENRELSGLIGIVNRYLAMNSLFSHESGVSINNDKLMKILEGDAKIHDANEGYNDDFFELSMAIRFAVTFKANDYPSDIDLTTVCDVIAGKEYAIECKYLHSLRGLRDNVAKAIDQAKKRVDGGLAKLGIVALDLSNVCDNDKIWDFSQDVFSSFLKSYGKMANKGFFSNQIREDGVLSSIISDGNFSKLLNGYISHEADSVFYSEFGKREFDKLNRDVIAIIYQTSNCFCFELDSEVIPVPFRSMGYYVNPELPRLHYFATKGMLNNLASGI
ncbi:hypothetical protein [Pectobacterium aroidearum]|uniref:hypothetical protein n=1 Tax=Pectobacterium aroidearum TaxID=1201031 RepID=UPI0032EBA165